MNWKLTLTKALVMAGLAFGGCLLADIQSSAQVWGPLALAAWEVIRDFIKTRFGSYMPDPA